MSILYSYFVLDTGRRKLDLQFLSIRKSSRFDFVFNFCKQNVHWNINTILIPVAVIFSLKHCMEEVGEDFELALNEDLNVCFMSKSTDVKHSQATSMVST